MIHPTIWLLFPLILFPKVFHVSFSHLLSLLAFWPLSSPDLFCFWKQFQTSRPLKSIQLIDQLPPTLQFFSFKGTFSSLTWAFSIWQPLCCAVLSHFSHVRLFATLWILCPGSSVHRILQARILEWVAMLSSRGSSWPKDRTHICISSNAGRFFTPEPLRNPLNSLCPSVFPSLSQSWLIHNPHLQTTHHCQYSNFFALHLLWHLSCPLCMNASVHFFSC